MTSIIKLLHQPLPQPGDRSVTWKQLHQHNLTKMMRVSRMTHEIAAALLYKTVVVNNLTAFLLGADDIRRPSRQQRWDHPDQQTHICADVYRKLHKNHETGAGYVAYICPRHNRNNNASPKLPHKADLIKMVETIHLVYSDLDKTVYHHVAHARNEKERAEAMDRLNRYDGLSRYLSDNSNCQTLDFERLTIASWMADSWNERYGSYLVDYERDWERAFDLEDFERTLCVDASRITANYICRSVFKGPLASYPAYLDRPLPSRSLTLHAPPSNNLWSALGPGIRNTIHIPAPGPGGDHVSAIDWFFGNCRDIARELLNAQNEWGEPRQGRDTPSICQILRSTTVAFYVQKSHGNSLREHSFGCEPNTQSVLDMAGWALEDSLQSQDDHGAAGWEGKITFKWADEAGSCEACGRPFGRGIVEEAHRKEMTAEGDQR